ncbi:MAG TPA: c-type cytochrome [Nocardioidaceae bacterium]|nr:c-type cytochrome [Nocardioidaceae bacterium]
MGLLFTGGAYAVLSPATAQDDLGDNEALVAQGRELFLVGCASCHGKNAEGIIDQKGTQYGPSLVGVGAAAVDFQVSTGRMPMAQPGAQAPRKDSVYSDEEVRALAAYVASLGPGPAIPTEDQYSVENADNDSVVRGGQFFLTNCTACHNFAGTGGALPQGRYAPTLEGVDPKYIYEAMLTGPQQMPVFSDEVLEPDEKRDIIAYIKSLEEAPNYGGFSLGGYGPVSEGMFAWLLGIGSLVGFAIWIAANSTRSKKGTKA